MPSPTERPTNIRKRPLESDRAIQFLFDIPRDESGKQLPESDGLLKCDMCGKKFKPNGLNRQKAHVVKSIMLTMFSLTIPNFYFDNILCKLLFIFIT